MTRSRNRIWFIISNLNWLERDIFDPIKYVWFKIDHKPSARVKPPLKGGFKLDYMSGSILSSLKDAENILAKMTFEWSFWGNVLSMVKFWFGPG